MILLGITGSVAATLTPKIVKSLIRYDAQVEVILTKASYAFVNMRELCDSKVSAIHLEDDEWTWGSLGHRRKYWKKNDPVLHIELMKRADMLVIAPATANTIAKMAHGICDNLLTSVVLAWDKSKPMYVAPAMNTNMWMNSITQDNLNIIRKIYNAQVIPPVEKQLACGDTGVGGLADIDEISNYISGRSYKLDKWWFPVKSNQCSGLPVDPHPGSFGYIRRDTRHTGVDIYVDAEYTPVYAVEPGKIVCVEPFTGVIDNSPWWNDTDCIMVEGETGVVCYGEIQTNRKIGEYVKKGEHIANVKRVIKEGRDRYEINGWRPTMLHLELYPHGTYRPSNGFESHLRDPTPFLLESYGKTDNIVTYANYKPS